MSANELRIGNLINVLCDKIHNISRVERVDRIDFDHVLPNIYLINGYENYSPIPITEEWLFKFGFEKMKSGIFFHPKFPDYELQQNVTDTDVWGMGIDGYLDVRLRKLPEIKFIHQLQNLFFALTGEELKRK